MSSRLLYPCKPVVQSQALLIPVQEAEAVGASELAGWPAWLNWRTPGEDAVLDTRLEGTGGCTDEFKGEGKPGQRTLHVTFYICGVIQLEREREGERILSSYSSHNTK